MRNLILTLTLIFASATANAYLLQAPTKLEKKYFCVTTDQGGNILDSYAISDAEVSLCIRRGGMVMDSIKLSELQAPSPESGNLETKKQWCSKPNQNLTYISCEKGCTHSAQNCVNQGGEVVDM